MGGGGRGGSELLLSLLQANKRRVPTLGTEKFRASPRTECDLLYEHRQFRPPSGTQFPHLEMRRLVGF